MGTCDRFALNHFTRIIGGTSVSFPGQDKHFRELLRLVDPGVGEFLREVQAELVRTSRIISDLRRRVTYLSICLLGVRREPLFVPQILPESFRRRSRL